MATPATAAPPPPPGTFGLYLNPKIIRKPSQAPFADLYTTAAAASGYTPLTADAIDTIRESIEEGRLCGGVVDDDVVDYWLKYSPLILTYTEDSRIVGMAAVHMVLTAPEPTLELGLLCSDRTTRATTKIGKELIQRVEALARSLGAKHITLSAIRHAEGFYTKMGYESVNGNNNSASMRKVLGGSRYRCCRGRSRTHGRYRNRNRRHSKLKLDTRKRRIP